MKKLLTLLAFISLFGSISQAQQDPMFTKYMFNSLIFNPAYAGSADYMSIGVLHRTQWYEINGAPTTQSFTFQTPLRNKKVGIGLSLINDKIGPTNSIGVNAIYAYKIKIGAGQLSFGLQGGLENYRADWSKLDLEVANDNAFDKHPNMWLPNFGAGIYFFTKRFYVGVSSPHLLEYDLRSDIEQSTEFYARQARHYYFMTGAAFPLGSDDLVFKPSVLVKNVGLFKSASALKEFKDIGAPTEFDVDLSMLFRQTFWIGASFRSAVEAFGSNKKSSFDSADVWMSVVLNNGLRIGAAYDYPLTEINSVSVGAFEVMLGYDFHYESKRVVTPRYF